ncbi:MAG: portal protein [Reyranellaceae bacterium]
MAKIRYSSSQIQSIRNQCDRRLAALERERSSWFTHWQEVSKYILPRRGRFLVSPNQADRGGKINSAILDESGTFAARTFAAGMMSGITSPARPWFRFTLGQRDPRRDSEEVRAWLDDIRQVTLDAFARSNAYNALGSVYEELGVFGTGVMLIDEDEEDDIRCYALTVGEYYLGSSARLAIDTLYRVFPMTVAQLVQRFGLESCSDTVADMYRRGDLDVEHEVVHAIEPNDTRVEGSAFSEDKPFRSVYFERGASDRVLACKGYDEFPAMCPRWTTIGNDAYGRGPGMDGLPAVRTAQLLARRHAELVDKTARPPMQAPATLKNEPMSALPGGVTFLPFSGGDAFKPAYVVSPAAIVAVREAQKEVRQTISRAFHEDLFLMLSQMDGVQPRQNLEVIERREEKMLMLGPALERLHDELLDRCLKRVVGILRRRGRFPRPPRELTEFGARLQIEYISVLAQAQKSVGLTAIERLMAFVGGQAAVNPAVLDKIDQDRAVEVYAEMLNVPPDVLVSDAKVAAIRLQRAQQQQQMRAAEMAMTVAKGAKVLSETDVGGGVNALERMIGGS